MRPRLCICLLSLRRRLHVHVRRGRGSNCKQAETPRLCYSRVRPHDCGTATPVRARTTLLAGNDLELRTTDKQISAHKPRHALSLDAWLLTVAAHPKHRTHCRKKLLKGTHQSSATHAFEPHIGTASMTTPSSRGATMEAHSVSSRWSTRRRCTPTRAAARLKPKRGRAWSGHAPRPRARLTMQLWRVRRRAMAHASHSRCLGKK